MRRKLLAVPVLAAVAATVAIWAPSTSRAGASGPPGYEPHLDPKDFTLEVYAPKIHGGIAAVASAAPPRPPPVIRVALRVYGSC